MIETFEEVALAKLPPFVEFILLFLLKVCHAFLHALGDDFDDLDGLLRDHFPDLLFCHPVLLRNGRVKMLDKREVLLIQLLQFISALLSLSARLGFNPCLSVLLLLPQLLDHALVLQNLMVERVHLILVLEQVVFVDIFNLEFVVLGATRLDAVLVVE